MGEVTKLVNKPMQDKWQLLLDKITNLLKQGTKPWEKTWMSYENLITKHRYTGWNPLLCSVDVLTYGYKSPYFIGFSQAAEMGWRIKAKAKATWIKWAGVVKKEKDGEEEFYKVFKWLKVFNADCIDDSKSDRKLEQFTYTPSDRQYEQSQTLADLLSRHQPIIKHEGFQPCYKIKVDTIYLPEPKYFKDNGAYESTLLHEIVHWTGAPSRCDRKIINKFGSEAYAFEELVAEMGSVYLCGELGIKHDLHNHASYLSSWLKILDGNVANLQLAMKLADKAVKFLEKQHEE